MTYHGTIADLITDLALKDRYQEAQTLKMMVGDFVAVPLDENFDNNWEAVLPKDELTRYKLVAGKPFVRKCMNLVLGTILDEKRRELRARFPYGYNNIPLVTLENLNKELYADGFEAVDFKDLGVPVVYIPPIPTPAPASATASPAPRKSLPRVIILSLLFLLTVTTIVASCTAAYRQGKLNREYGYEERSDADCYENSPY